MKIIVCADMHGRAELLDLLLAENKRADGFVFLGDGAGDFLRAPQSALQFHLCVKGNCDLGVEAPVSIVQGFEGIKVLMTHGHLFGAKQGAGGLIAEAKRQGCALVLYGHTHTQKITEADGVTLLCPGALSNYKYAILEIKNGKIDIQLKEI